MYGDRCLLGRYSLLHNALFCSNRCGVQLYILAMRSCAELQYAACWFTFRWFMCASHLIFLSSTWTSLLREVALWMFWLDLQWGTGGAAAAMELRLFSSRPASNLLVIRQGGEHSVA
jgi:hypothetical protein